MVAVGGIKGAFAMGTESMVVTCVFRQLHTDLATIPRIAASSSGDTSAQFAPSPDNKQKLSRAGNWAPDRLVTVGSSPRSKHRKKRGRMQCVRQSDEVEVPAMIARFWDGTASYGHVPRALACTVQAGFAPKQ